LNDNNFNNLVKQQGRLETAGMVVTEPVPGLFEGTEMPDPGWWRVLWPAPAQVLAAVGLKPGMEAIDLCAGDGWFTLPMAEIARQVVAIDLDERLLAVAKARVSQGGLANCTYIVGDAYRLARLVTEPVDFVFMANAFHGVPDRLRLSRAVREVLKPSGRFAIVNWHRRRREETTIRGEPRGPRSELRMSPEQTIAAVEPAGLKRLQVVDLPPYHYGAVFQRPST
jgi:SAM-dependent methyltransferase